MQEATAEAAPTEDAAVPGERKTLTIEEASQVLGIGRSAGYAAAHRGEIPTVRIGRRLLVPAAALDRLLTENS